MDHHVSCDPSTLSLVETQIRSATVFVVSKTKCKACMKAKKLLNKLVAETGSIPSIFEVDILGGRKRKKAFINWLSAKTGIKTVPQIWINGRFVGGNDDIQQRHREGKLVPLILMKTRSSIYMSRKRDSNLPKNNTSTSDFSHRMKRGQWGAPYQTSYITPCGDGWVRKSKPVSTYTVVPYSSQLRPKISSNSSATAKRFGLPQVQTKKWFSSSGEIISNSSSLTPPNNPARMKRWMIGGTGVITGWI